MTSIEFTAEEAQVLINLVDIAVKTTGLQAAEAGIHFAKKLSVAIPKPATQATTQPAAE